ncbi:MAG TPA: hypothetical protein VL551_09330 [Actinospica sp.]|jgi:hypothetical protein|nr:hypothetical protein [Actinospica sp.]
MHDLAEASTTPAIVPASLRVTLACGQNLVSAEFAGMRPLPSAPTVYTPFHWTPGPEQAPTLAVAPVFLGVGEGGRLFVDLALAPSVITVTGRKRVRDELGAELVNRLGAAIREGARRFAAVVAGAPFDLDLLVVDPIRVGTLDDFDPTTLPEPVDVCFVFCSPARPADAQAVQRLSTPGGRRRIVPILVDDVVAADWSLFGR